MVIEMSETKGRRLKRKQQLRKNGQLKRRLFKNVVIAPCCYCKVVFLITELTIEHIHPLSLGGTNEDSNIALACAPCNQERGRLSWLQNKQLRISKRNEEQYTA